MKKLICALLLLALLPLSAGADFDNETLEQTEDCIIMMQPGSWDKLVCPMNQPYQGDLGEDIMHVSIDFIQKVDLDVTLIRVMVGIEVFENVYAEEIAFVVGGKSYAFTASAEVFEYDGVFQEDYYICLTDASLPFLKALAQQKKDNPIPVQFFVGGEMVREGSVVLPGAEAAWIYDLFIDLGGKTQALKELDDMWPCRIDKVK